MEISPLLATWFANIFFHTINCLLTLFMVSFAVQKVLSLLCPICLFLFLLPLLWETDWKKYLCESFLPMFSSKSLMNSGLIFRSLIQFECNFVYGIKECSIFILYIQLSSFPRTIYWRDSFLPCIVLTTLIDYRCMDLFLVFQFCSTDL